MAGIFFIGFVGALHVARDFFMPVALAILLALTLTPAVRLLRRCHIPTALGAAIVLLAVLGLFALAGYFLSGPLSVWVQKGPETFRRVSARFESVVRPMKELKRATEKTAANNAEPAALKVESKQTGMLKDIAAKMGAAMSLAGTTFILLYFLLATGDVLLEAAFVSIQDETRRQRTVAIGHEIKQHISKYLLAISLINLVEGALIAGGLALAGMPTPLLWGAMHAVLNFIPYIGAITGLVITALVAVVSFDSIPRIIIPPAIYLGIMILDNFASPMVLGKRLVLNPVLVFVSLMFWGWVWGVVGILVAIPILIAYKIVCDHVPDWNRYGRIISADTNPTELQQSRAG